MPEEENQNQIAPEFKEARDAAQQRLEFSQTKFHGILIAKLTDDLCHAVNALLEKESDEARGSIKALKELLGWANGNKEAVDVFQIYQERIKETNDY